MYELLAISVGVLVGVGLAYSRSTGAVVALGLAGAAGAFGAFALSGEIEFGAEFLAWDLAQVVVAAVLTRFLVRRLILRRATS